MRQPGVRVLCGLAAAMSLARAAEVVYVTDLDIFSQLVRAPPDDWIRAPALYYEVMTMTDESCPQAVTALASCVCSNSHNMASVASAVSSDVSGSCGSTASSDQSSASVVLKAYCNQEAATAAPAFTTPSPGVTQYITDIPEFGYLPPCVSDELSNAIMDMTYSLCPSDAPALATCACAHNQNSLAISQFLNTQVSENCSGLKADISTAQAFFAAYCALNGGTSSFPAPSVPAGDITYYITDMPEYSSLAGCPRSALSDAVLTNTYDVCPSGPLMLASCVCFQDGLSSMVSSYVSSGMLWDCSTTTPGDLSSAMAVYELYCSAVADKTTIAGITTSVAQDTPYGVGGSGGAARPTATATRGGSATGSRKGSASSSSGSADSGSGSSSTTHTGAIVGAVVGGIGGLALLAAAAFLVWRKARKNAARRPAGNNRFQQLDNLAPGGDSKSELMGTPLTGNGSSLQPPIPPPSPNLSTGGYNKLAHTGSPATSAQYMFAPPPGASLPPQPYSELPGQQYAYTAELQGYQQQTQQAVYEAEGMPAPHAELYASTPAPGVALSPQIPDRSLAGSGVPISLSGMTFQSGPVPLQYTEQDARR